MKFSFVLAGKIPASFMKIIGNESKTTGSSNFGYFSFTAKSQCIKKL
jgi:hypothetical protein